MKNFVSNALKGLFALSLLSYWGCQDAGSFLDQKVGAALNEEIVFADSAYTMDYLSSVYQGLTFWYGSGSSNANNGPWGDMTDELETKWPGGHNFANQIVDGLFGETFHDKLYNKWVHFYKRIRQANIYLKNVNEASPLSPQLRKRTRAEMRFLRAYHYALLMQAWGGVPLVGDTVYDLNSQNQQLRNTYAECVEYIISELDAVAPQLPLSYSGRNYGRITRGACLALKARVLLYAASPLYNGGSPATDPRLKELTSYPNYDPARWEAALQACQDVVNLGVYALKTDNETRPGNGFYELFLERVSDEIILARMEGPNKNVEKDYQPRSRGGNFLSYPLQELVDAFPMKNGLSIADTASGYDPEHPYENRDPRFYYSIIYNGCLYFEKASNKQQPVWTYKGASQDGIKPVTANTGTSTGYYVRKMMDDFVTGNRNAKTDRSNPVLFRYGHVLLNLAEAAVETGNISLAMEQLMAIRERAGIEPGEDGRYGIPLDPMQDEARELVRNERYVELAFEGHRFWDLRRWKDGERLNGKYMHGMEITKNGEDDFSYKRITTRKRYFEDNIYFLPIPIKELEVSPDLLQNPGW